MMNVVYDINGNPIGTFETNQCAECVEFAAPIIEARSENIATNEQIKTPPINDYDNEQTKKIVNEYIEHQKLVHAINSTKSGEYYVKYVYSKYQPEIMDWAARDGYLDVVKFLYHDGAECSDDAFNFAIANNNIEIIKFLHSVGLRCKNTYRMFYSFVSRNNLKMIKYLVSNGYEYPNIEKCTMHNYIVNCFDHPNLEMIEFMHSTGCKLTTDNMDDILYRRPTLKLIKYLYSVGYKCSDRQIKSKQCNKNYDSEEVFEFLFKEHNISSCNISSCIIS